MGSAPPSNDALPQEQTKCTVVLTLHVHARVTPRLTRCVYCIDKHMAGKHRNLRLAKKDHVVGIKMPVYIP